MKVFIDLNVEMKINNHRNNLMASTALKADGSSQNLGIATFYW